MQSVGKLIRATRLQNGLSLEDISAHTRICIRNLQAIEEDDISAMPSAFFYKSFVNQFGRALGIESDTLSSLMEGVLAQIPEPLVPGQAERIAKGAVIRSSIRPRKVIRAKSSRKLTQKWRRFLRPELSLPLERPHVPVGQRNSRMAIALTCRRSSRPGYRSRPMADRSSAAPSSPSRQRVSPGANEDGSEPVMPGESALSSTASRSVWLDLAVKSATSFSPATTTRLFSRRPAPGWLPSSRPSN